MQLPALSFLEPDPDLLAAAEGRVAVFLPETGKLDRMARRVNRLTKGALERFANSDEFARLEDGQVRSLDYPTGMKARAVDIVRLDRRARGQVARRAGGVVGAKAGSDEVIVCAGRMRGLGDFCLGALLASYRFNDHRTPKDDAHPEPGGFRVLTPLVDEAALEAESVRALAEGVYFTRDLVNEPANVLTTTAFCDRLQALSDLGVTVDILDEDKLTDLGMRTLLAVGQGSDSPSRVVVMQWNRGADTEAPVALLGKGVVFDTGGISIKPAVGMEAMTMDMGGAGTVAGVMRALALRKARVNVVGIVGLVENMPDGRAMRPGDVIRSMKGDTVEVVNTDAEGRLVLADLLWYASERFKPSAMIDLATLTGAVVVALGKHHAGLFSPDDALAGQLIAAAKAEGEGLWQLPLGARYARQLDSRVADLKNSAGRDGGAVTAAEFLRRFVDRDTPWAHLDIAGVATIGSEQPLGPKGATGWGVLTLNRWIAERHEGRDSG